MEIAREVRTRAIITALGECVQREEKALRSLLENLNFYGMAQGDVREVREEPEGIGGQEPRKETVSRRKERPG